MKYRNHAAFSTVLIITLALTPVSASRAEEAGIVQPYLFHVGAALLDFSYKEFDDDGSLLDREDGVLPGVVFAVTQIRGAWFWSGRFALHRGDVAYDGEATGGLPVRTRTNEQFIYVAFQVDQPPRGTGLSQPGYYAGFEYRVWERDIRSNQASGGFIVIGPYEMYQWWSIYFGFAGIISETPQEKLSVDLRLMRSVNPNVRIDFHGLYDNVHLDLGERFGARLALPWQRRLAGGDLLTVEPYLEGWKFGRSADHALTQGGVPAGAVFEPRSETRNIGIQVGLTRPF